MSSLVRPAWVALRPCPNATPGPSRLPALPLALPLVRRPLHRRVAPPFIAVRLHSTTTPGEAPPLKASTLEKAPASSLPPHATPPFEALSAALSASQPCFGARGDEVKLLTSPGQFKAGLLEMIKRARKRILISSLYIGAEEQDLVDALSTALASHPQIRLTIILDYHRATRLSKPSTSSPPDAENPDRTPPSTAHLLLPLLEKFPDRCEVWLYRSPKLRGLMERIVPERYDEGWGTWHGKWYGVDDEVILSGANLAQSYFTNRQDRYIHFRSHPTLLSYLTSLTRLFTHFSYLLHPSPPPHINRAHLVPLAFPPNHPRPPSSENGNGPALVWPTSSIHPRAFEAHAKSMITAFQNSWRAGNPGRTRRVDADTWFWPVIQAGVLGVSEEEQALARVWEAIGAAQKDEAATTPKVEVDLTSGYFGLYKAYKRAVLDSPAPVRLLAASPKSNGFYRSKGLSRLIPEGYTLLESRFWWDAQKRQRGWNAARGTGVRLKEWEKEGWTYHSKGIWLTPTSSPPSNPFLTFIGSSNLSTRSLTLDTELSLLLMTSSPSLRRSLGQEVKALDANGKEVGAETWKSEERRVSWLARVLVALGVEGML